MYGDQGRGELRSRELLITFSCEGVLLSLDHLQRRVLVLAVWVSISLPWQEQERQAREEAEREQRRIAEDWSWFSPSSTFTGVVI